MTSYLLTVNYGSYSHVEFVFDNEGEALAFAMSALRHCVPKDEGAHPSFELSLIEPEIEIDEAELEKLGLAAMAEAADAEDDF